MSVTIDSGTSPALGFWQGGIPLIFTMSDGHLVALYSKASYVETAISADGGNTWTASATSIYAPPTYYVGACQNGNTLYLVVSAPSTSSNSSHAYKLSYTTGSPGSVSLAATSAPLGATVTGLSVAYQVGDSYFHAAVIENGKLTLWAFRGSDASFAGSVVQTATCYGGSVSIASSDPGGYVWAIYNSGSTTLTVGIWTWNGTSYTSSSSHSQTISTPWTFAQTLFSTSGALLHILAAAGGALVLTDFNTGSSTFSSPTTLVGSNVTGAPILSKIGNSTDDLLALYTSTTNESNGEIYQLIRASGTWYSPALLAGGANTGWSLPSIQLAATTSTATSIPALYLTGTGSDAVVFVAASLFSAPSAPTGLSPSGGASIPASPPAFSFIYNNTNSSDGMSAYNATIYKASDNSVVWTSGKTTGTCASGSTYSFTPGVTLTAGTNYYWSVLTYDQGNLSGATSANATFTAIAIPTTTITSPTNASTWILSALTIDWSYNERQGNAQASYQIQLLASDNATVLLDTGTQSSVSARSATLSYSLANTTVYYVQVRTTSSVGGTSAWSNVHFTVSFTPPDVPTVSLTPISDTRGTRMQITWSDYRQSGRDFAPTTAPYLGNWLQLATGDSTETWTGGGTATGAAVVAGDSGQYVEGNGALKLSSSGSTGTVTATRTPGTPITVSQMRDGATAVVAGDLVSCAIYASDWSKITPASCTLALTVSGTTYSLALSSTAALYPLPVSGSGWWHCAIPLSAAAWPVSGNVLSCTQIVWTITLSGGGALSSLWIDDLRIIRYAGHTARSWGSGYNTVAQATTISDNQQSWITNQFATPPAPQTPYVVSDSNGAYWAITANTPGTLTVTPLQGQSATTPVGAYTIWRADFLETLNNVLDETYPQAGAIWRTFYAENGEATSTDTYTYGQTAIINQNPTTSDLLRSYALGPMALLAQAPALEEINAYALLVSPLLPLLMGSLSSAHPDLAQFAIAQTLGQFGDVSTQVELCGAASGPWAQRGNATVGIVLRWQNPGTYYAIEINISLGSGVIYLFDAGVRSVVAHSTGLTGTVVYVRAQVVGSTLSFETSADGVTWINNVSGTDTTITSGYVGLVTEATSYRFDRFWVVPGGGWPSSSDPQSFDIQRQLAGQNPAAAFNRIAAALTSPPGSYVDWHCAIGQAYDYRLVTNGANGTTSSTS